MVLLVGTAAGLYDLDAGVEWLPTVDIDEDVHQVVAFQSGLGAAAGNGLLLCTDGLVGATRGAITSAGCR